MPEYPQGVFVTYEIRYDEDNKKESGPYTKHFDTQVEYFEWWEKQNRHPWLHIHVITESA